MAIQIQEAHRTPTSQDKKRKYRTVYPSQKTKYSKQRKTIESLKRKTNKKKKKTQVSYEGKPPKFSREAMKVKRSGAMTSTF